MQGSGQGADKQDGSDELTKHSHPLLLNQVEKVKKILPLKKQRPVTAANLWRWLDSPGVYRFPPKGKWCIYL